MKAHILGLFSITSFYLTDSFLSPKVFRDWCKTNEEFYFEAFKPIQIISLAKNNFKMQGGSSPANTIRMNLLGLILFVSAMASQNGYFE